MRGRNRSSGVGCAGVVPPAAGARADRTRGDVPRVQYGDRPGDRLRRPRSRARDQHTCARRGAPRGADWVRRLGKPTGDLSVGDRIPMTDDSHPQPPRLGVLISGRGSNLQSIIDAIAARRLDATLAVVISNRSDAPGLQRAREASVETLLLNPRDYPDRTAYDRAVADALESRDVTLVCLAGYM